LEDFVVAAARETEENTVTIDEFDEERYLLGFTNNLSKTGKHPRFCGNIIHIGIEMGAHCRK
jgi:hypothetical protein